DALAAGFPELMWVDSDVAFEPDDVGRLRAHGLPFTCGLYPKKGPRQFACEFLPDTPAVRLGRRRGLVEVRYCGFGFAHTRRAVHALEVGVFEGRSTVWLLEHVLTHPEATLTWVDTFAGGADHAGMDLRGLEQRFRANTAQFGAKASGHVGRSQDVLRGLSGE